MCVFAWHVSGSGHWVSIEVPTPPGVSHQPLLLVSVSVSLGLLLASVWGSLALQLDGGGPSCPQLLPSPLSSSVSSSAFSSLSSTPCARWLVLLCLRRVGASLSPASPPALRPPVWGALACVVTPRPSWSCTVLLACATLSPLPGGLRLSCEPWTVDVPPPGLLWGEGCLSLLWRPV